jgi:hypothetical protein
MDLRRMLVMAFDFRRNGPNASKLLNQSFVFFRLSLKQSLGIAKVEDADRLLVLLFGILSRQVLLTDPLDLQTYRKDLATVLP